MDSDYVCLYLSLMLSPASHSPVFQYFCLAIHRPPHQCLISRCPSSTLSESYFYARQLPAGYILQPRDCFFRLCLSSLHAPPPPFVLIWSSSSHMTSPSLTCRISLCCLISITLFEQNNTKNILTMVIALDTPISCCILSLALDFLQFLPFDFASFFRPWTFKFKSNISNSLANCHVVENSESLIENFIKIDIFTLTLTLLCPVTKTINLFLCLCAIWSVS